MNKYRKLFRKHYEENQDFYNARYDYSHIYNKPGDIPLAKLQSHLSSQQIIEGIKERQRVSKIALS